MLFGQSSGALGAFIIGSLPQAPSLISAVALESGGGRDSPKVEWTKPFYSKYIRSLGCDPDDHDAIVDCLRSTSLADLNKTLISQDRVPSGSVSVNTLINNNGAGNAWIAVIDGKLVPENHPDVGVRVPAIFGSATNDGSLDVLSKYGAAAVNLTEADYDEFLSVGFGSLASTVKETYSYSAFEKVSPVPAFTAMTTVITDYSYKCPAQRGLQATFGNGINAFAYSFNHTPSCSWYAPLPDSDEARAARRDAHERDPLCLRTDKAAAPIRWNLQLHRG